MGRKPLTKSPWGWKLGWLQRASGNCAVSITSECPSHEASPRTPEPLLAGEGSTPWCPFTRHNNDRRWNKIVLATRLAQSHGLVYVIKLVQKETPRLSRHSGILLVGSVSAPGPCQYRILFFFNSWFTESLQVYSQFLLYQMQPHRRIQKYTGIDKVNDLGATAGQSFLHVLSSTQLFDLSARPGPRSFICHVHHLKTCPDWQAVLEKISTLHLSLGYLYLGRVEVVIGLDTFRHVHPNGNMVTQLSVGRKKGKVLVSLSHCLMMQILSGSWGWQEYQACRSSDLSFLIKCFSL